MQVDGPGAFNPLSTLPALMACTGEELAVFVATHFFSSFLDHTTQSITSLPV